MTKQMSQRHISAPATNFDPNISRINHNLSQLNGQRIEPSQDKCQQKESRRFGT